MLAQFKKLHVTDWLNGNYDLLLEMFPLLREFPNIDNHSGTPTVTELHELSHMMQFMRNNEEHKILLPGFGWGDNVAAFSAPRKYSIAKREAEVFAIQLIFQDRLNTLYEKNDIGLFNLDNISGAIAKHFEGNREEGRNLYWKEVIENHMIEIRPIFDKLADKTFQYIIDNKSLLESL